MVKLEVLNVYSSRRLEAYRIDGEMIVLTEWGLKNSLNKSFKGIRDDY